MAATSISAIIPAYNCEAYLGEAIDSVLNQSRPPNEVIVIDDGSTDRSAEVARGFSSQVQYVWQENAGAAAARNKGLALATGDYLAFLDADDQWTPEKLELQAEILDTQNDVDLVFGLIAQFVSPELAPEFAAKLHCPSELIGAPAPGVILARRCVFDGAGVFDQRWTIGEWFDWYARTVDLGFKSRRLETTLLLRRIHGGNLGIRRQDDRVDYVRSLKATLDRRRAARVGQSHQAR